MALRPSGERIESPGGKRVELLLGISSGFESFVDDLDIERGIVSSRVALSLRSAEIKPSFLAISKK
jgi:hypothetical protein